MNRSARVVLWLSLLLIGATAAWVETGCVSTPQPPAYSQQKDTRGVTITFRYAPPQTTIDALKSVGATPDASGLQWRLPSWDYQDWQQSDALVRCIQNGAVITK